MNLPKRPLAWQNIRNDYGRNGERLRIGRVVFSNQCQLLKKQSECKIETSFYKKNRLEKKESLKAFTCICSAKKQGQVIQSNKSIIVAVAGIKLKTTDIYQLL